jgi:alkylhydroperoxidase/carboxymuconolactone decarboxylase family protein YurZ
MTTAPAHGADDGALAAAFEAICLKLWGAQKGGEIHKWIVESRPPAFHRKAMQVMVPIWEMDRVDLRTKILCCISLFAGMARDEVEFFMLMAAHHGIPQEDVEEVLLLIGLEAGFPTAEKAIITLQRVYAEVTGSGGA